MEAGLFAGRADCPGLAFQSTKAFAGKIRASPSGAPHPPSLPRAQPASAGPGKCWLPDGSWDKNPLAVWARPPQQHVGGPRSDSTPSLVSGVVQRWCPLGKLVGRGAWVREQGWEEGSSSGLVAHQAWGKRSGVAAFIGQTRRLRLREAMSPARGHRAGHQPCCAFCLVTDSYSRMTRVALSPGGQQTRALRSLVSDGQQRLSRPVGS